MRIRQVPFFWPAKRKRDSAQPYAKRKRDSAQP
jgi:hypothetical protein